MRWTAIFLFAICMAASAKSTSQMVRLDRKSMSLPALFKQIRQQTGYMVSYNTEDLKNIKSVAVPSGSVELKALLDKVLKPIGLTYTLQSKTIFVTLEAKKELPKNSVNELRLYSAAPPQESIRGRVVDSLGNPLAGATIKIKGTNQTVVSNSEGWFQIETNEHNHTIEISYIGYQSQILLATGNMLITLHTAYSELDETIIQAYGKTSRRYNTGNISKVTAKEIEQQPVGNVLQALQGRVPGLNVTTSSGVPGASVKIQVRGQNSIIGGNDPLILIDGVPFGPNNNDISQLSSAIIANTANNAGTGTGLSAFNSINPMDIESVEVLKDADATAIYGSRGANGVILITTKKGKQGITKFNFNIYNGISKATRLPKMMNTQQYLATRREAFTNDGVTPDQTNAPDLTVFDTTRNTNFVQDYFGGTSNMTNVYGSVSGGSGNTQYLISGTYREENNIYSQEKKNKTGTIYSNISSSSNNKKFKINFNNSYTYNQNNQISASLSEFMLLAPDLPELQDSLGKLIWYAGGVNFYNPLRYLKSSYVASTENYNSNVQLNYELMKGLSIRNYMGYNKVIVTEKSLSPASASNPEYGVSRSATFANNKIESWSIEPQFEFNKTWNVHKLDILAGASFQSTINKSDYILAGGQSSDALLEDITAATSKIWGNAYSRYRYQAFFGRINYNLENKYLVNITGRRDGSSRFGDNHRFSNFGAIGMGWIFTNETFIKENISWVSFGKLRGSYGITGNDQIGDYKYLDSWTSTTYPYGAYSGLKPTRLANNNFSWEKNKKIEFGLELGFIQDRFLLTSSWFQNRSSNMLINYDLPSQTGFLTILKNFPGLVQNRGWEFTINAKIFNTKDFQWNIGGNLTVPQNKLLSYPNLATSSYSSTYIIGQSLSNTQGYKFLGVDSNTGLFTYEDKNDDGSPDWGYPRGDRAPKYYGGISNTMTYKNFSFDCFFEFKHQLGYNYLTSIYTGNYIGQYGGIYPIEALNAWKKVGDQSDIQMLTQSTYSQAYIQAYNLPFSSGMFSDASYVRLKTVSLSYQLAPKIVKALHIDGLRLYSTIQNAFTITKYKVGDPETQNLRTLAPLRSFVWGLQLNF